MAENNNLNLASFTDVFADEELIESQPLSLTPYESQPTENQIQKHTCTARPAKHTGQYGDFRSVEEIDEKYRSVFTYPYFNIVQSNIMEDAIYSDKSLVICAPTGSGKTVVFEMAIVQLLMQLEDTNYTDDFKIIYMAPVKALCTERLTEWYPKFNKLGLQCIEVTGDTNVDFSKLKPYRIIITTPEKWDVLTRRWTDYRGLVQVVKLFLIDEVHILNDESRGPVLEAVVSRMKTIESSSQSEYRIEQLKRQYGEAETQPGGAETHSSGSPPRIRFVAVSATVCNPEDVATWLGTEDRPAVFHKYGDECRPVKLNKVVEGYPCPDGMSIFKFDIILNYKLWPIIQKYYNGKPTLIFCNTRKSVALTAETISREVTITFNSEQRAKLNKLASTIKNKKLQSLVLNGVGCHHAGLLYEERINIEQAFREKDLPILITTSTLAMGVNLPAHLVIIKNTQQYINGAYQEYSISSILQMLGRAGRPQFDTHATAVIMTRARDKARYMTLVGGTEPLQSSLHLRLTENLNSEAALGTVGDVAQCVQWLRSTFLYVRARKDPRRYLGLPPNAAPHLILKKIEELCVKAMNGLASSGLITMDDASCIESTEAGRLMSHYYLDFETMKHIMKIDGTESLERLLWIVCESHELSDMHLRVDERRTLNALNRNNLVPTIRFPMKGKISTRQMKLNCIIQAVLGCLQIPDPSLNQEAMKIMRIAERICKCIVSYVTGPTLLSQPRQYSAALHSAELAKCVAARLWENSPFVSRQLRGIGPTFSTLLATAGKFNFMLFEESHPRDLERIMNKAAPAGNVLRKQISLLPKYQITMTPVDEKTVTIQLLLLNHNYLLENMDNLTAGDTHKSYIIVGDSENYVLLFTSFTDKNFITVFDGTITHKVTRKHRFEHKIFAHCISSSFVGIDAQCDYLFKELDPHLPPSIENNLVLTTDDTPKRCNKKQTNITDTFKERKRKSNDIDITQCKEKKKRENALIQKLESFKKTFSITSKALTQDLNKNSQLSSITTPKLSNKDGQNVNMNVIDELQELKDNKVFEAEFSNSYRVPSKTNTMTEYSSANEITFDESVVDDGRVDCILKEIENEISRNNNHVSFPKDNIITSQNIFNVDKTICNNYLSKNINGHFESKAVDEFKQIEIQNNHKRYNNPIKKPDNYSFIDLLERNVNLSEDDEVLCQQPKENIFSNVQQYLEKAKAKIPEPANVIEYCISPNIKPSETNYQYKVIDRDNTAITIDESDDSETLPECGIEDNAFPHLENDYSIKDHLVTKACIPNKIKIENDSVLEVTEEEQISKNNMEVGDSLNNERSIMIGSNDQAAKQRKNLDIHEVFRSLSTQLHSEIYDADKTNEKSVNQNDELSVLNNMKGKIMPELITSDNNAVVLYKDTYKKISDKFFKENNTDHIVATSENYNNSLSQSNHDYSEVLVPYQVNKNLSSHIPMPCNLNNGMIPKIMGTDNINDIRDNGNDVNSDYYSDNQIVAFNSSIPCKRSKTAIHNYKHADISRCPKKYSYESNEIDVWTQKNKDQICTMKVVKRLKVDLEIQEQKYDKWKSEQDSPVYEISDIKTRNPCNEVIDSNKNKQIFNAIQYCPNTNDLNKVNVSGVIENHNWTPVKKQVETDFNAKIPETARSAVDNLLQKYVSKIKEKAESTQIIRKDSLSGEVKSQTNKNKKPFKISDIHQIDVVLPKTLVNITSTPNITSYSDNNVMNTGVYFKQISISPEISEHISLSSHCDNDVIKTDDYYKQISMSPEISDKVYVNEDIPVQSSEDISDIASLIKTQENESNFNIDQAMLNPKTILQFMNPNENEIIPPPPQFCDNPGELTAEKEYNDLMTNMVLMETSYADDKNYIEEIFVQSTCDDETYTNKENSMFDNVDQISMTPTKEIETWTFASDDEPKIKIANCQPRSCTVIRENYPLNTSKINLVGLGGYREKLNQLDQFKFNTKSKFKVTRNNMNQ